MTQPRNLIQTYSHSSSLKYSCIVFFLYYRSLLITLNILVMIYTQVQSAKFVNNVNFTFKMNFECGLVYLGTELKAVICFGHFRY